MSCSSAEVPNPRERANEKSRLAMIEERQQTTIAALSSFLLSPLSSLLKMTSYASATAAWTPPQLEAHPDPSLLTTDQDSESPLTRTKDALDFTPPLTPPLAEGDNRDKLSSNKDKEEEKEIPGSDFDHVIPGVAVMETRQLPDDLEKKIAKPCK